MRLARHLKRSDLPRRESIFHDQVVTRVREAIARARSAADANMEFIIPVGTELVEEWPIEDLGILEELVSAVNDPRILREYLPWVFSTIQLMLANGPAEFAKYIRPHVVAWTHQLPLGRSMHGDSTGPFSIVQFGGVGAGEIALILGWLAFQLPRKLGGVAHKDLLAWARQMLIAQDLQPMQMVVYAGTIVALGSPSERSAEALSLVETALLSLWTRASNQPNAADGLASALRYMTGLFRADDSEFVDWRSENGRIGLQRFIGLFQVFLPLFARSPRSVLRAAVAELLCQVVKRTELTGELEQIFTALKRDNRARVRFSAEGSWQERRNKMRAVARG